MQTPTWMEFIPHPVVFVDADGVALEANRAFLELATTAGCVPSLVTMFGTEVLALIDATSAEVHCGLLPLLAGSGEDRYFRLSVAGAGEGGVVALLSEATEEMAIRRRLVSRDRDLAVLQDLGSALGGTIDLDDLGARIYEQTTRVIRTSNLYVAIREPETGMVSFLRYIEDGAWKDMTSRAPANGFTEYILRTGEPLLIPRDVGEFARSIGVEPLGRPSLAWLGVPIAADGEVLGVIGIQDYEHSDCYDQHDLQVLTIIAVQAAGAIRNARLLGTARQAYEELSETQARLLEAERVRSIAETAGALNHEINNPLAAIAGNAQLLLRRPQGLSAEGLVKIEAILDATRRIQSVTTKMASLIQASTMPYPSEGTILDVKRSVATGDSQPLHDAA